MNPTDNFIRVPPPKKEDTEQTIKVPQDTTKDFKKVMDDQRDQSQKGKTKKPSSDLFDEPSIEEIAEDVEVPNPSILALARKQNSKLPEKATERELAEPEAQSPYQPVTGRNPREGRRESTSHMEKESPFSLYKQVAGGKGEGVNSLREAKDTGSQETDVELTKRIPGQPKVKGSRKESIAKDKEVDLSISTNKEEKVTKNRTTRFDQEQPDLSYVNPLNTMASSNTSGVSLTAPTSGYDTQIAALKDVVDQLVDKMYTVQTTTGKDTIVELNFPDKHIFEGARVVVSTFNANPKDFNLTFENLRPDAKQLIDINLASLTTHLEQAGFANAVHIIATTTYIERPLPSDAGGKQSFAQGDRDHREGEGRGKRGNR